MLLVTTTLSRSYAFKLVSSTRRTQPVLLACYPASGFHRRSFTVSPSRLKSTRTNDDDLLLRLDLDLDYQHDAATDDEQEKGKGTSVDSGTLIWDAGRSFAEYLVSSCDQQDQDTSTKSIRGRRIIELGAGTGIVGLTAARLGAKEVILTDKPELLPLMERNIKVNGLSHAAKATPLVWGEVEEKHSLLEDDDNKFDLVLGSDLLYSPDSFEVLIETIQQLCEPLWTQIWLAYPRRFTEDIFLEQAWAYGGLEEIEPTKEIESGIFLSKFILRE